MREEYSKLFEDFYGKYRFQGKQIGMEDMCHFVSMKGIKFDSPINNVKLMIIGRATNDWGKLDCSNSLEFGMDAEKKYYSKGFEWVCDVDKDGNNRLCSVNNDGSVYYLNSSAFWRTSENIWMKLTGVKEYRWIDYIAWSNLYKIAPKGANPTTTMCKRQYDACKQILQKEIEEYRPSHILMITGVNWWKDENQCNFAKDLFSEIHYKGIHSKNKDIVVEATAEYRHENTKIPVVVTCRPERCSNKVFIESVINAYSIL